MNKRPFLFVALSFFILASCSSGSDEQSSDSTDAEGAQETSSCIYQYNDGTTKLTWTGYKTTAKKGVPGSFNEITVSSEQNEDPKRVIESVSFSINTNSVETNDESRNEKISTLFFDVMNTPFI